MRLTRRGLLIGTGAGGALLVAWAFTPRRFDVPIAPGKDEFALSAWLRISQSGVVSVAVPQLEMGQGVSTQLAQVIAWELGADWRQISVEPAPLSGAYANPVLAARWAELWMPALAGLAQSPDSPLARRFAESEPFTATADGTSLAAYEVPAREAAAAARAMLAMAAADRWAVGWEQCEVSQGLVTRGNQRLSFGELIAEAVEFDPPEPPVLRPQQQFEKPAEFPPGSKPRYPRLDLPAKVDGSAQFAGDIRLPDMRYAAIRHGPLGDSRLGNVRSGAPKGVTLVRGERWLAAVADNWWSAEQALAAIAPAFTSTTRPDSRGIASALEAALKDGPVHTIAEAGDGASLFADKPELSVRYAVAPALHGTIETASATARFTDGRLELWIASQAPRAARRAAATALGIAEHKVVLYPMPAGGSFDRRLESEHAAEAALIAREIGKPVQLMWSRWQEHVAGLPRTPVAAQLAARTAPDGALLAWHARLTLPATTHEFGARLFGGKEHTGAIAAAAGKADRLALEGSTPPYFLPNLLVEHAPVRLRLPTARLRGNAHHYGCFFTESFIDELAKAANHEPLSYRITKLPHDPILAECLQRAATLAAWSGGSGGQGLACHAIGTGRIALVASARQEPGAIRVDKLTAVVNIGRILNVDIARQQIEGGLVFGLGLALGSATEYRRGLPTAQQLAELNLPRLADCPEIEVEFIDSTTEPVDPGELGVAVVAPAVANALFAVTGQRLRRLPLGS